MDLVALLLLVAQWDSVADDNAASRELAKSEPKNRKPSKSAMTRRWHSDVYIPLEAATVQVLNSLAGQNTVDNNGVDFEGTVLHDGFGSFDERAAGVGHIIDDDSDLILDVTDKDHARDLVGAGTFLVNKRELQIQAISNGSSTNNPH